MLSQSSIKIVDDDENRDLQKWTQKEMGAEAPPSGCAKKTEEGRVDDGEEEHIVSQENEIG